MTLIEPLSLPKFDSMPQMPSRICRSTPYLLSMAASSFASSAFLACPVSMRIGVTALARYSDVVEVNSGWLPASFMTAGSGSVIPANARSNRSREKPAALTRGHRVFWTKASNVASALAAPALNGGSRMSERKWRLSMKSLRFGSRNGATLTGNNLTRQLRPQSGHGLNFRRHCAAPVCAPTRARSRR